RVPARARAPHSDLETGLPRTALRPVPQAGRRTDFRQGRIPPRAHARARRFLSYYRPHLPLLAADLACALLVSATALLLPLCANHVTKRLVQLPEAPEALWQIWLMGGAMLALIAVEILGTLFV